MSKDTILVAIDGSLYSRQIVDKAIEYARFFDNDIFLIYCHRKFSHSIGSTYNEEEISSIMNESEQLIAPYLQHIKDAGISVEERIMEEPAGETISDVARIEKCSLIVMGSRGLTNLAGLIVGSVTNSVLQTAPCSVLVVR